MEIVLSETLKNFFITAFDEAVQQTIADGSLDRHCQEYRKEN